MTVDYVSQIEAAKTKDELSAIWKQAKEAGELTAPLAAKITAAGKNLTDEPPDDGQPDEAEQLAIREAEKAEAS